MSEDPMAEFTPVEREAYAWVVRFASGDADQENVAALRDWAARSAAHREAFDRFSRTWNGLPPALREMPGDTREASGLYASTARIARSPIARRAFLGGALAASAAGAAVLVARPPLGLWPSWSELSADYRTGAGERRKVAFADNVSIEMNTRTSLSVRAAGSAADRIELISGEAAIEAPKGATEPFTLRVADSRIVAQDARFNVRYEEHSVCVTCLAGQLLIERPGANLPLPAHQQITYTAQETGAAVPADPAAVTAWQDGLVIFRSTPVSDVIAEVNRYRPGRIILTDAALGRQRFNARFRIENIGNVVGQIEQVFGAKATELPGGVVLLG
jgi:transmembrane sensor